MMILTISAGVSASDIRSALKETRGVKLHPRGGFVELAIERRDITSSPICAVER